ncbi:MAG: PBP1A family penicillin-binding protein [Desulfobulbaceae bacterium]|nr:PBP1A family penicillin-binding protein [Candidatus Kapabacteria bacterium]MBS4001062.1 PBP1A family penicillin-binding protein [Desulfobulbaceae bacterium]
MKPLHLLILLCLIMVIVTIGLAIYIRNVVSYGLPSLEQLENPKTNLATRILSSDGVLLDHFFIDRRINMTYDSIPKDFINALTATEDKKFFSHWGVHAGRIINAFAKRFIYGDREGASTITMQLSRNLFLNQDITFERKIREAFISIKIEQTYTKEEILEMYTNTVNYGRGAYGIQVAAQTFFDKLPSELTTAECALLVAMLKAPSNYDPIKHPEKALRRRNLVLKLMYDQGYLTGSQHAEARKEAVNVFLTDKTGKRKRIHLGSQSAPHFVEMIRQDLSRDNSFREYDLYRDGLIIHTTLNSKIQQYVNEAVEEHLKELQASFNKRWNWNRNKKLLDELLLKAVHDNAEYNSADAKEKPKVQARLLKSKNFIDSVKNITSTIQIGLVVIDPANGAILAMVGASPKFMRENPSAKYSLNHARQISRQPGSAYKPMIYAMALNNGYTPESKVECGPFSFKTETGELWEPSGTGNCESGEMTSLTDALRLSINTVSARLVTSITNPTDVVNLSRRMGISTPLQAVPAISLGAGGDVEPLELTSAYGSFVYDGIHIPPYYLNVIEDKNGTVIKQKPRFVNMKKAMEPEIARQMTYMLERVVNAGTASRAIRSVFTDVDAAGKTGTTNDAADAWFVGYTPQLVAGVWLGFDDKRITFDVLGSEGYGGRSAAPIWGKLMAKIYADQSLSYREKTFTYKKTLDSVQEFSLPYPLTKLQKEKIKVMMVPFQASPSQPSGNQVILPDLPTRRID